MTTTQTALCIIPPEDVWMQIQTIRSKYDKAYPRWMPHINFIYPFVTEENFAKTKERLESVLKREKPFSIRFDASSFHYFKQTGDECTYHLQPTISTEILRLQNLIQTHLTDIPKKKRAFQAHLTLGQTTTAEIDQVLADLSIQWQTIEFTIDRVYMISRENHPENLFVIKNEILLLDQADEASSLHGLNYPVHQAIVPKNYLCVILPNELITRLFRSFENTSLQPTTPCRFILAEYDQNPVSPELRSKLEATMKFTLIFGPDALQFDPTTSRLYLRPTNIDVIEQLNVLDHQKYDGTLTLGQLRPDELDKVKDRFSKNCPENGYQVAIDRLHLADTNGKYKFIFRLK